MHRTECKTLDCNSPIVLSIDFHRTSCLLSVDPLSTQTRAKAEITGLNRTEWNRKESDREKGNGIIEWGLVDVWARTQHLMTMAVKCMHASGNERSEGSTA